MTKRFLLVPLAVAIAVLAAGAQAKEKEKAAGGEKHMEMKPTGTPGKVAGGRVTRVTATVKAVDPAQRTLTLQGAKGEPQTIKVEEHVKRLDEIQPGDKIVAEVQQGLLLEAQDSGAAPAAPGAEVAAGRTGADQAPGAGAAAAVQATVTITAIDPKTRMVVFKGPEGNLHQVKAGPKLKLERAKVGDQFLATYVETVAIKVEKAKTSSAPAKKEAAPKEAAQK
jgi:hypothetical protein